MSRYKQTTNTWLTRAGIEVRRKPPALVRSPYELPMTLEFAAAHLANHHNRSDVVVLQVGAFDGRANDPVFGLLGRYGWRAILVEPQPRPFEALADLHRNDTAVQVFNVGIADHDGTRMLFTLDPAEDLPPWAPQIASFNRHHLATQQKFMPGVDVDARIRAVPVTTWTIDTLLANAGVDRVDLLQVDTEGYDLEILRLFDVPARLPALINYEHQHLTAADRAAAADLLISCGYRLAMSYNGGDTLAYRQGEG